MIDDNDLRQLEARFGLHFVEALKAAVGVAGNAAGIQPLRVGEAKDRFSQVLEDVRSGHCRVVQKRSEEPVLMISIRQLGEFVEQASPRRRFADLIAPDASLPSNAPALRVSRQGVGRDKVRLAPAGDDRHPAASTG
jgi:hypothetical protein